MPLAAPESYWAGVGGFESFDRRGHCDKGFHLTRLGPHLSVVFNTPFALVDVTVYNFLRMCLADRVEGDRCSTKRTEPTTRASLAERDIERNGTMTSTFRACSP
ncbi:hypothetical protein EVAR_43540_1 [Eumeta japonica]|uniref:Uncharacterized protein n=1 Tax=Eumeta variegata TaxID=151549 RepID=A0A4C1WBL0_EUMVA|nr:hypothetical protein EVAR_43540_1 [Eumeta japonica]